MTTKRSLKSEELERLKFDLDLSLNQGIDLKNRTIRITGHIGDPGGFNSEEEYFDYNHLEVALTQLESQSPTSPITIKINSFGGSVYEALAIVGRLKSSPCQIITEGYGAIMSAATLILMCADVRKISRYAVSMFHSAQYGLQGDHENIKEQVIQAEKEEKLWANYYAEFSNRSPAWWLKRIKKTEYYPTADEMLQLGAVDEII
jgi:ATP-dependent protease ClpP protease subunit